MSLPHLKQKKMPRIADEPRPEKSYGLDSNEELENQCIQEMIEACKAKDTSTFMQALEALIMTCFENGDSNAS
jgi:hypothetical protein